MQGLALARAYFDAYGAPMIERQFAAYKSSMAVGLVGEGSECFGYDDAFSQDHDFGPGFCIWLPQTVYARSVRSLSAPTPRCRQNISAIGGWKAAQAGKRVGVWSIEQFYQRFTGIDHPPRDNMEWFRIPEEFSRDLYKRSDFLGHAGDFQRVAQCAAGVLPAGRCQEKAGSALRQYGAGGSVQLWPLDASRRSARGLSRLWDLCAQRLGCDLSAQRTLCAVL